MKYNYKINSVDNIGNRMEIKYSLPPFPDTTVIVEIPNDDIVLEDYVHVYAPVREWKAKTAVKLDVIPGTSGEIDVDFGRIVSDLETLSLMKVQANKDQSFANKLISNLTKKGKDIPESWNIYVLKLQEYIDATEKEVEIIHKAYPQRPIGM